MEYKNFLPLISKMSLVVRAQGRFRSQGLDAAAIIRMNAVDRMILDDMQTGRSETKPAIKGGTIMIARRVITTPDIFWRTPFSEMEHLRRQMDLLTRSVLGRPISGAVQSGVFPALNLTEDQNNYYVRAELPGIQAEQLDIKVSGRNLTISGERKIPTEDENVKYHRREREAGKFSKVLALPGQINAEQISAKLTHGVLRVTVPKAEAQKPKQINVH
jgi:HSP20 family protein